MMLTLRKLLRERVSALFNLMILRFLRQRSRLSWICRVENRYAIRTLVLVAIPIVLKP